MLRRVAIAALLATALGLAAAQIGPGSGAADEPAAGALQPPTYQDPDAVIPQACGARGAWTACTHRLRGASAPAAPPRRPHTPAPLCSCPRSAWRTRARRAGTSGWRTFGTGTRGCACWTPQALWRWWSSICSRCSTMSPPPGAPRKTTPLTGAACGGERAGTDWIGSPCRADTAAAGPAATLLPAARQARGAHAHTHTPPPPGCLPPQAPGAKGRGTGAGGQRILRPAGPARGQGALPLSCAPPRARQLKPLQRERRARWPLAPPTPASPVASPPAAAFPGPQAIFTQFVTSDKPLTGQGTWKRYYAPAPGDAAGALLARGAAAGCLCPAPLPCPPWRRGCH